MPRPVKLDYTKARTHSFEIARDFGDRLDVFLAKRLPEYSRSLIQRCIREGRASHNGRVAKPGSTIRKGDRVTIEVPLLITPELRPAEIPLNVVFEDEHIIAIDKPPGMVVHPTSGHWEGTLMNALLAYFRIPEDADEVYRPGVVHRLDRQTSGVILAGKTHRGVAGLARQFRERRMQKEYHAIVEGQIRPAEGVIDKPIKRHPKGGIRMGVARAGEGREASSSYRVLERFSGYTYVAVTPLTGRTHQIRVHVATIGHPCAGDPLYSASSPVREKHLVEGSTSETVVLNRQALHAYQISFEHPVKRVPLVLSAPLPEDMGRCLELLRSGS
jgi:23S rRNA pseudouridine1911/1915/1917 synthase